MNTKDENVHDAGDYARYKMLEVKAQGFGIVLFILGAGWFLAS